MSSLRITPSRSMGPPAPMPTPTPISVFPAAARAMCSFKPSAATEDETLREVSTVWS
jgi:hypothetical protein